MSAVLSAALMIAAAASPTLAWDHAHGDAGNAGFVDVTTAPAALPIHKISGLGNFAPGAGPVVAADGTTYVGNTNGQLRQILPNGQLGWMRDTPGDRIIASPAIGADGTIYVVGTRTARDHRGGRDVWRFDATLYRFTSFGAMLSPTRFPEHAQQGTGATSAAPVIWRSGADEVVMIPALYRLLGGYELRLLAFSTQGGLLFDQKVTGRGFDAVTGDTDWGDAFCSIVPVCLNKMFGLEKTVLLPNENQLDPAVEPPMPGVGIFYSGRGSMPVVVVADNYQYIVGYNFSPMQGFREIFRKHLTTDQIRMSSPVLLRDGHSAIRGHWQQQAWVLFGGPATVNWTEAVIPPSGSTPTLTADGTILMVDRPGGVTVIGTTPNRSVLRKTRLKGESIVPAAASCTHVFVSTADAFVTLDAKATSVVASFDWRGGGLSSPAIGGNGQVYALAGDSLHIFPRETRVEPTRAFTCREPGMFEPGTGGGPILR
jgi:hypothetical protein